MGRAGPSGITSHVWRLPSILAPTTAEKQALLPFALTDETVRVDRSETASRWSPVPAPKSFCRAERSKVPS